MVNETARRVAGVNRSARLPVLHATAGLLSAHNSFVQQCAAVLDLGMRAQDSCSQEHLIKWTEEVYGLDGRGTRVISVSAPEGLLPLRIYRFPFYDFDLQESWLLCVLGGRTRPGSKA